MKIKKTILSILVGVFGIMLCLFISNSVNADTYKYEIDGYTVIQNENMISVIDGKTGLAAYLDANTGVLTDIDGTVSYVNVNPKKDFNLNVSSSNSNFSRVSSGVVRAAAGPNFKRGVWNYVTTTTYNLGYIQSVQSFIVGLVALIPGPTSIPLGAISSGLGAAALVNSNVTVKITQYYDPAQPTKIKEDIVTYKNGKRIGSSSIVRNIF